MNLPNRNDTIIHANHHDSKHQVKEQSATLKNICSYQKALTFKIMNLIVVFGVTDHQHFQLQSNVNCCPLHHKTWHINSYLCHSLCISDLTLPIFRKNSRSMLNKILCKNNCDEKISSELKQEPTLFFLGKEILKSLKSLARHWRTKQPCLYSILYRCFPILNTQQVASNFPIKTIYFGSCCVLQITG